MLKGGNMTKREALNDPNSCWNKARMDEEVFVLLGRDVAAPDAIEFWCGVRVKNGKNDNQIQEAIDCANRMRRKHYDRHVEEV